MLKSVFQSLIDQFASNDKNNSYKNRNFWKKIEKQIDCKYSYWNDYINNPVEVKLKLNQGIKINKGGKR
jgi:hypothetical protein